MAFLRFFEESQLSLTRRARSNGGSLETLTFLIRRTLYAPLITRAPLYRRSNISPVITIVNVASR